MTKNEYIAKYGEEAYQRKLESNRQWRKNNPEYYKQWRKDNPEYNQQWSQNNKEKIAEQQRQWREDNPEYRKQYQKQYRQTPMGRASKLCGNYQKADKQYSRGECTLTAQWIVDHIFPNGCLYCGEKDWTKLGCDRVDNDLPHTPDNVVCCCADCNKKRSLRGFDMFLYKSWRKRFV